MIKKKGLRSIDALYKGKKGVDALCHVASAQASFLFLLWRSGLHELTFCIDGMSVDDRHTREPKWYS